MQPPPLCLLHRDPMEVSAPRQGPGQPDNRDFIQVGSPEPFSGRRQGRGRGGLLTPGTREGTGLPGGRDEGLAERWRRAGDGGEAASWESDS